ncbi:Tetratricopeptide repeat protein [Rubrivivax sp. A210]|uniref:tetratricopeptide repeat protein n=1 Tax=Rubrivivax sp. A210 TaxID=2772301 RepID=UPI0019191C1A|nr:tetratricopeptide repeat protein [Rubrivivax sp. A210]CAD5374963.1 Tetratricopeptide repeat protein [Rubrivivax sp. A210]
MSARRHLAIPLALAALALLAACGGTRRLPGDDQPTLATLAARSIKVEAEPDLVVSDDQTIAAYRSFLEVAPKAPQRAEAMRRLGDLEMDRADRQAAEGAGAEPDYRGAIARYEEFLKAYPKDPRTDRVLYQLARAQEQGGQLEPALATLSRLVQQHPGTLHADEAHFRRGELLFAMRDYPRAEAAYASVLASDQVTPLRERALYMQGWSRFKQGRLDEGLRAFFGVLDLQLGGLAPLAREEADLSKLRALKRADRELVEDTFRVVSLSLAALQGADAIPRYIDSDKRAGYEFRVYQQLGELYIRQERIKDAADSFAAFVRRQPLHAQAPLLQARVIEIYQASGFQALALQAKKDHVERYGAESDFRRANRSGWTRAQPLVKTHLGELASHHHALAQQTRNPAEVAEAVRWYRALLKSFGDDADAAKNRFLLAELLFESRQYGEAAAEYEFVAYRQAQDARAPDAGYAALLAYAALEKGAGAGADGRALQRQTVDSSLRFAKAYPRDARAGAVLTNAADKLFALGEGERAQAIAREALALQPAPEQRRVAWTVIAHQTFEEGTAADAEQAYAEVLALTPVDAPARGALVERQAAAVYRQAEEARAAGRPRDAVGHFQRVIAMPGLPATAAVRASAQVDAAAALIALQDWEAAARTLEDFRREQPGHALQAEVAPKLALAYLELGRAPQAAAEFERVAGAASDPELARGALWQAAELHQKAAERAGPRSPQLANAIRAWERYLQQHPQPLESAVQARWQLAALQRQDGQPARATAWLRAVQTADAEAGAARTPLTRKLGGQATLALAEPALEAYRKVALIEPLARQLKLKKTRLDEVLAAYAAAAEAGVLEVTTQATQATAALYQDFGKALMGSQRPRKLSKLELEQYNVMLEEQAFPFEEKAIALFETNAGRIAAGVWDEAVRQSLAELARLKPVRWGKAERGAAPVDTTLLALQTALAGAEGTARAPLLNQIAIKERQAGRLTQAREAYAAAITVDATAVEPRLNLAILLDLYLGEPAAARALYQQCLELSPADAQPLSRWLAEMKTRKPPIDAPPVAAAGAAANTASAAAASTASNTTAPAKETQ